MFDLIAEASNMFSKMISFSEVAAEVNAEFECSVAQLPTDTELGMFFNSFCPSDIVEFSIKSYLDFTYCSTSLQKWIPSYSHFIESSESSDIVKVDIHINKKLDDNYALSIYSFSHWVKYYSERSFYELVHELSDILKKHSSIFFRVIDTEVDLSTESIFFCNEIPISNENLLCRDSYFESLNKASLFLNRNDVQLTPNDFRILRNAASPKTHQLEELLRKLETIFSLIFLAYSSHIVKNSVVLQLSPTSANLELEYSTASSCTEICNLYQWVFSGDHTIERSGIVRNLLSLNCKSIAELYQKDDSILLSAKSNYILFQRDTIDKYIKLKNSISLTIVEATKNAQEIFQSLIDAVRNNFIAVIMFLITVVLTDSVSWDDITTGSIFNEDLLLVLKIYCAVSFAYLCVTLFSVVFKWLFLSQSYKDLKLNYSEFFDKEDLLRAFENDKTIKRVRNTVILVSISVTIIWILFLNKLSELIFHVNYLRFILLQAYSHIKELWLYFKV